MVRINARILVVHFDNGRIQTAFAARRNGESYVNILGQEFKIGKLIAEWPLTAANERRAEVLQRAFQNKQVQGARLTPAQREEWQFLRADIRSWLEDAIAKAKAEYAAREGEKGPTND